MEGEGMDDLRAIIQALVILAGVSAWGGTITWSVRQLRADRIKDREDQRKDHHEAMARVDGVDKRVVVLETICEANHGGD